MSRMRQVLFKNEQLDQCLARADHVDGPPLIVGPQDTTSGVPTAEVEWAPGEHWKSTERTPSSEMSGGMRSEVVALEEEASSQSWGQSSAGESDSVEALSRRLRVLWDRFDLFAQDHEDAKFSIANDCLSLARGAVKHKSDLRTIAWTRVSARAEVWRDELNSKSLRTHMSSGILEESLPAFTTTSDEYHFHETVWDASLLVFFPHFGCLTNLMLLTGLVTNISVQCLFCWIVFSLPGQTNDFTDEDVEAFVRWNEAASSQVCGLPHFARPSTPQHRCTHNCAWRPGVH